MPVLASPLIRRVTWHLRRVTGQLDRRFFLSLTEGIVVVVAIAALLITLLEKPLTIESLFDSFNWGVATVLGQGNGGFVTSPGGRAVSWLLILFGVAMLGLITGSIVAMVIDFLLKEGAGLGAAGHKDHIIVCGWNSTARDLIDELRGDDYKQKVVVLANVDKNPAGAGVYFVRGDATDAADLERAGIEAASSALIFPVDGSDEADMHSILVIMAISSIAPNVRTVAEVNNPRHEPHFWRADVDELLVTSKMASHLLARSALYPGLSALVTDIVSGGEGSELYRITLARRVRRPVDRRRLVAAAERPQGDIAVGESWRAGVRQSVVRLRPRARRRRDRRGRGPRVARAASSARHHHDAPDRGGRSQRLTTRAGDLAGNRAAGTLIDIRRHWSRDDRPSRRDPRPDTIRAASASGRRQATQERVP